MLNEIKKALLPDFRIVGKKRKYRIKEDPIFNNRYVTALTCVVMKDGKKSIAYKIVVNALNKIKEKHNKDPCDVLYDAIVNAMPSVELKSSAGFHFAVPTDIKNQRSFSLSLRFIIKSARKSTNTQFENSLASMIWNTANGKSDAIALKDNMHATAAANNAFKL
jgi:small subunit ribosomal protein S7